MSRPSLVRLVLALLVLGGCAAIALTASPRLGLDLSGGTQIVLQTSDSATVRANASSTDRTLGVLRGRVDALGVSEPTLARSGENRIIVELPGVQDPREALRVIGKTAQLTFHPVLGLATPKQLREGGRAGTPLVLRDESGAPLLLGPAALPGDHVSDSSTGNDPSQGTGWFVTVDFKGSGKTEWRELTAAAACEPPGDPRRRVAIVLDDKVISSPQVDPSVPCDGGIPGGSTQITGTFTPPEAEDLSILIKGGALPVPVHVVEQRTVGPTLGKAAIGASFQAGLIGLVLTGLFIAVVYRLMG
ncbi:MAG: SecDF P1 head subdomain-containing protein, partial [Nocardioidaceae bacterium]